VLFVAVVYLIANLLVDVAHGLLDPRIRRSWSR
jgi:ABC-type dipeptide/oligopeptide/nickel transport system permease component